MDLENKYKYVKDPEIYAKDNKYTEFGLFSEQIFGPVRDYTCQCGIIKQNGKRCPKCGVEWVPSSERDVRTSKILIPQELRIIAPQLFHLLIKLDSSILKELESYKLEMKRVFDMIEQIQSGTYPSTSQKVREIRIMIEKYPEYLDLREITVIPPGLRPISGNSKKYLADQINDTYQRILEHIDEFNKSVSNRSIDYHNMILQKIIYQELYLNEIINKLSSKQGIIRQKILGKRVDFSGRTVIVPDYSLPSDIIRVPYEILVKIFEPYILNKYSNIIQAFNDIEEFNRSGKLSNELKTVVNRICTEDKIPVIINRQPTLHRMSMRAYYPIPTTSKSIHIPVIIVDGFNADFDGDQMAIYAPLIEEEIKEYVEKFINHRNQIQHGRLKFSSITQFAYGVYIMSKDDPVENPRITIDGTASLEEIEKLFFEKQYSYSESILVKLKDSSYITTFGRYFLSMYLGILIDYPVNKSIFDQIVTEKLLKILETRQLEYNDLQFVDLLLTKHLAEISPTISMRHLCDIYYNEEFRNTLNELRQTKANSQYKVLEEKLMNIIKSAPETRKISDILKSGAKGGFGSLKQLLVSKGYVVDVMGQKVPYYINSSLIEGLSFKDMYVMSHGSRKGSLDRSVNTATTGYLMRKMIFALQDVEYDKTIDDCGAEPLIEITLTDKNYQAYLLKYFVEKDDESKTLKLLTQRNYKQYLNKTLIFRSPINCRSKKICTKCLGHYDNIFDSRYVGIIAAQALGERMTQLTMRTFHTGGVVSDVREEIDPQYFSHVDDNYFAAVPLEIDEVDEEFDSGEELTNNLYFTLEDGTELMIPKGSILNINIRPRMKISKGTKVFTLVSASSVVNMLDIVIGALEHPDKHINSWEELYDLLFKSFYETEGIISLHIELLISNMLRVPEENKLARVENNLSDYYIMSIKKIPILRKILTMGYQGFHKNLLNALITNSEEDVEPSILEKVIIGVDKENLGLE